MDSIDWLITRSITLHFFLPVDFAHSLVSEKCDQIRSSFKGIVKINACNRYKTTKPGDVGSNYVFLHHRLPNHMRTPPPGQKCVSFDHQGNRLLYYYHQPNVHPDQVRLLDGSRMAVLFAMYIQDLMISVAPQSTLVVVQTITSNSASSKYLERRLRVHVRRVPVSRLAMLREAAKHDVALVFDEEGFGTLHLSPTIIGQVLGNLHCNDTCYRRMWSLYQIFALVSWKVFPISWSKLNEWQSFAEPWTGQRWRAGQIHRHGSHSSPFRHVHSRLGIDVSRSISNSIRYEIQAFTSSSNVDRWPAMLAPGRIGHCAGLSTRQISRLDDLDCAVRAQETHPSGDRNRCCRRKDDKFCQLYQTEYWILSVLNRSMSGPIEFELIIISFVQTFISFSLFYQMSTPKALDNGQWTLKKSTCWQLKSNKVDLIKAAKCIYTVYIIHSKYISMSPICGVWFLFKRWKWIHFVMISSCWSNVCLHFVFLFFVFSFSSWLLTISCSRSEHNLVPNQSIPAALVLSHIRHVIFLLPRLLRWPWIGRKVSVPFFFIQKALRNTQTHPGKTVTNFQSHTENIENWPILEINCKFSDPTFDRKFSSSSWLNG